ncbi:MAG: SRPBCC family protein [Mediterranea sp.]|jgi:hypothetical protein|nr:SRPBCC family protein [Mediterranea sp.]
MIKVESRIKIIPFNVERVFYKLSDLNHLESVKGNIHSDKVQGMSFDRDTVTINMLGVGEITLAIVEREPYKHIKFETTKSPLPFVVWIQLDPLSGERCKMRLIVNADVNPIMNNVLRKPLQNALEKMAEILAEAQY